MALGNQKKNNNVYSSEMKGKERKNEKIMVQYIMT